MKSSRLLFVDDEEGLLQLYRTAFSREGYDVEVAATLDEARTVVQRGGVDLVVLDIRLTDGSGLSLLHELKGANPRMPVILSTAFARYQDDFSSWLADAYVVKSSDLSELKGQIKQCLESKK